MTIIEKVAAMHGVPAEQVRADMQEAIRAAGFDMEPELFIALMAARVKMDLNKENPAN